MHTENKVLLSCQTVMHSYLLACPSLFSLILRHRTKCTSDWHSIYISGPVWSGPNIYVNDTNINTQAYLHFVCRQSIYNNKKCHCDHCVLVMSFVCFVFVFFLHCVLAHSSMNFIFEWKVCHAPHRSVLNKFRLRFGYRPSE